MLSWLCNSSKRADPKIDLPWRNDARFGPLRFWLRWRIAMMNSMADSKPESNSPCREPKVIDGASRLPLTRLNDPWLGHNLGRAIGVRRLYVAIGCSGWSGYRMVQTQCWQAEGSYWMTADLYSTALELQLITTRLFDWIQVMWGRIPRLMV